jgi:hypothetical protein
MGPLISGISLSDTVILASYVIPYLSQIPEEDTFKYRVNCHPSNIHPPVKKKTFLAEFSNWSIKKIHELRML